MTIATSVDLEINDTGGPIFSGSISDGGLQLGLSVNQNGATGYLHS